MVTSPDGGSHGSSDGGSGDRPDDSPDGSAADSSDGDGRPLLYHEVHGNEGPFLLLVHGMLSSRAQWMLNIERLSEFCRPVVVELLGHGRSPTPEDPARYSPAHYVEQFDRIRHALGAERWLLCGQSLGAALTLRYALEHPGRVIAQAFTNSSSAFAERRGVRPRAAIEEQARRVEEGGRAVIDEHPLNPARNRRFPPALREAFAADSKLVTPRGFAWMALHTIPGTSVRDRAHELRVPSLLVVGEREERFGVYREFAKGAIPRLEIVGLDGGHAVNIDAAEQFDRALRTFFLRQVGER